MLCELPFTLQHDREIVMFRFYFPLFIKLCMILLCVIFKSERYLRAAMHAMCMFDWKQPAMKIARGTTNNQQNKFNSVKHVQRQ